MAAVGLPLSVVRKPKGCISVSLRWNGGYLVWILTWHSCQLGFSGISGLPSECLAHVSVKRKTETSPVKSIASCGWHCSGGMGGESWVLSPPAMKAGQVLVVGGVHPATPSQLLPEHCSPIQRTYFEYPTQGCLCDYNTRSNRYSVTIGAASEWKKKCLLKFLVDSKVLYNCKGLLLLLSLLNFLQPKQ